jgi:hypothetical protein
MLKGEARHRFTDGMTLVTVQFVVSEPYTIDSKFEVVEAMRERDFEPGARILDLKGFPQRNDGGVFVCAGGTCDSEQSGQHDTAATGHATTPGSMLLPNEVRLSGGPQPASRTTPA